MRKLQLLYIAFLVGLGICCISSLVSEIKPTEKVTPENVIPEEPGKLILVGADIRRSFPLRPEEVTFVDPIVRNIGGQPVHVDKFLIYFGDRIGLSVGETVQPGEEKALVATFWGGQSWWTDDESVGYGAWSPERSTTIRFVFFENVETEGMSQIEIYKALKERRIGNVILENEITYAFENIVREIKIDKSWSFNTSIYGYPYTITFETMRVTNRFDSKDVGEDYKWVIFEFGIEYGGLRKDRSGYTLQHFELEVDKGYIYEVEGWREVWLHQLSTYIDGELSLTPGETYEGEIAFEILADTEPVKIVGLGGFDSIQIVV